MKSLTVLEIIAILTTMMVTAQISIVTVSHSAGAKTEAKDLLGSLFLAGNDTLTSFKPINKTYTMLSYSGNRTIFPPNSTNAINGSEIGNLTFNLRQNGISIVEGQSTVVTKGNNGNGSEQESATAILVDLNGIRPKDPRSSTGVAFFTTNSTGKLAFLNNMVGIYQVKASPLGTAITYWEWKGAD